MCQIARHCALNFFSTRSRASGTLWVGWSKLRVHFEVSQCLSQTVLDLPCNAAGQVGGGVFRIEPDRLIILGYGAVEVALEAPSDAAVVVGFVILRIEPDRLVVVGDGAVEIALSSPDDAAVAVMQGTFWIEPDRLVKVRHCPVEIALAGPSDAACRVGARIRHIDPH